MTQRGNDGRDWNAKPLVMAGVMITGRDGQTHSRAEMAPRLLDRGRPVVTRFDVAGPIETRANEDAAVR